jgi:hypothetical protein
LFCQRIWNKSGLALLAGSVVLATVTEAEESNTEIQREKVAAEEDQQAQQNASLPTAQRSTLETELKNAQERAQLAEKMADLAKSQQSALETELKKALERAQLAEKHSDLTERKLSALEAALAEKDDELKNAQERAQLAEKNCDPSDPNTGPKAEPLASTQPSDSSVQSGKRTARPWLASNSLLAAIESQNEENKGIGFAEATAPVAVEPKTASKNDPVTPDQQPVKLARINQGRSAVPLPTPSAAASILPTSPEAQTDRGIWASREVQSLKELILEYHGLTMISPQENSSPQMGTPDSSQIPVPALASEINQPDAQPNASPESSARGHDSARMIPPKIPNIRHTSVVPSRFVDVKARLIALWHQSLARSQRGSSRTVLSNSKKDANKKADATWKGW